MSLARLVNTLCLMLVCWLVSIGSPGSAVAAKVTPLPQSSYAVRSACGAPVPRRAACLALNLQPKTDAARARVHSLATRSAPRTGLAKASECALDYPSSCLTPKDLRSAYFPGEEAHAPAAEPQTIALVDAYNDPSAEADLSVYSSEFGLPACTKANGCFKQVSQSGDEAPSSLPFPQTKAELEEFAKGTARQREEAEEAEGWALEIATDVEVAHAVCHNCQILLVEASSPAYSALEAAEDTAALHGQEISNSWGGQESGGDSPAFDHPGVVITAAAGDDGYMNWDQYASRNEPGSPYFEGADYPAASPHVISVGGTHLSLGAGGAWASESAWDSLGAGGSGCSDSLQAAEWQRNVTGWAQVGCGQHRANADISADADPATGVDVYDSIPYSYEEAGKKLTTVLHWAPIGGTSVASPIIASIAALAGGAHGVAYPAQTLYSRLGSALLHDVTAGGNGQCDAEYLSCGGSLSPLSPLDCGPGALICNAGAGYDGPTGVGTPNGIEVFEPGVVLGKGGGETGTEGEPTSQELGKAPDGEGSGGATGGSGGGGESGEAEEDEESADGQAGAAPATDGSSTSSTVGTAGVPHSTASGANGRPIRISALALTANARAALRHGRIAVTRLAFSFTLSQAEQVRATLAIRTSVNGRARWSALPASLTLAAIRGVNRRRMRGAGSLAPGVYRLTLAPTGGAARAITIRVL
jgi:hypothetical protein